MTIEEFKKHAISDFGTPAWTLLEKFVERMNENGIFIDKINGVGLAKDQHDGKQVSIETVYRHNGTYENQSIKIRVDERKDGKYIKYFDKKIASGASDKVIDKRINEVLNIING